MPRANDPVQAAEEHTSCEDWNTPIHIFRMTQHWQILREAVKQQCDGGPCKRLPQSQVFFPGEEVAR